jgi:predicted SAM-dependent methyltransferase
MNKLNIGCGKKIMKDAINLDFIDMPGVDVVMDIEKTPWTIFKDNQFDQIYAFNVLEHVDNFIGIIEEIHRILKPMGRLHVIGPNYMHSDTFTDPTHKRGFTPKSFQYFEDGNPLNFYSKSRFIIEDVKYIYNYDSFYKYVPLKKYVGQLLWNIIQTIEFRLQAVK